MMTLARFRHSLTAIALMAAGFSLPAHALEVAKDGAEIGKWTMDFDAATKLAGEKKLPILLNFTGSDWCGWCKLMDESVYSKKEWQDYAAKNLLLVTIDFPQDQTIVPEKYSARNGRLQEQFKVEGYPTYVLLDSDGKTEIGRLGAGQEKTPESFITEVEDAVRLSPANIEKRIAELGPEKGAELKAAIAKMESVETEFKAWLETIPARSDENDAKFEAFQKKLMEANKAVTAF
jgi:thioredoxin-related protein